LAYNQYPARAFAGVHQLITTTSTEEFYHIPNEILMMASFKKWFRPKGKASRISSREPGTSPEAEVEKFGLFLLKDETAALNNIE
jgi:hypothetical protein